VIGLALLVAFRPRARDQVTVAAFGAALVIGMELTIDHWFYLYVPWFLPLLLIALLGGGREKASPSGAAPAAAQRESPQADALRS
jgi:hypothetical protein